MIDEVMCIINTHNNTVKCDLYEINDNKYVMYVLYNDSNVHVHLVMFSNDTYGCDFRICDGNNSLVYNLKSVMYHKSDINYTETIALDILMFFEYSKNHDLLKF